MLIVTGVWLLPGQLNGQKKQYMYRHTNLICVCVYIHTYTHTYISVATHPTYLYTENRMFILKHSISIQHQKVHSSVPPSGFTLTTTFSCSEKPRSHYASCIDLLSSWMKPVLAPPCAIALLTSLRIPSLK